MTSMMVVHSTPYLPMSVLELPVSPETGRLMLDNDIAKCSTSHSSYLLSVRFTALSYLGLKQSSVIDSSSCGTAR
jgi:hypothetical protein